MKLKNAGLILIIASSISVLRIAYYQSIYFSPEYLSGISLIQEFFNFIFSLFTPIALILVGIALYNFKEKKEDSQHFL